MSKGMTLVCLCWMVLCMFGLVACNVRAGIPSMRKPASREMISAPVELSETSWHKRVTSENTQDLS